VNALADALKETLTAGGAAVVGFADLTGLPEENRPELPRGVVFGVALNPRIIDGIRTGPTKEYYDLYNEVNAHLADVGKRAERLLTEAGFRALVVAPTVHAEGLDIETLSASFSHKMAATRAGLGWVGKCALLVTPDFGSAIRFATVLTDADLPTGEAVTESNCGECTSCVDVCPGHAPSGKTWEPSRHRDDFFDARACLQGILDHNLDFGFICGMCIAACPWTDAYIRRETGA
jgi:epoxyqueuosine reductase QueG